MKRGDVCYGMLRAAACVDESDQEEEEEEFIRIHRILYRDPGRPLLN